MANGTLIRSVLGLALVMLVGCDRREGSGPPVPFQLAPGATAPPAPRGAPSPGPSAAGTPDPWTTSGGAATPGAASTAQAAQAAPAASPGSAGDRCERAVTHLYNLIAASAPEHVKRVATPEARIAETSSCRDAPWSPAVVDCLVSASSWADYQGRCWKLAYAGTVDLTIRRRFDIFEDNTGADPPVHSQDGDFLASGESGCGSLMRMVPPTAAVFVVCNGEAIAGPLTTEAEIRGVYEQLASQQQTSFEISRSIRARWPHGGGTYRVYGSDGRALYDTY